MKRGKRAAVVGAGLVVAAVLSIAFAWGWRASQTAAAIAGGTDTVELHIDMQCEGWSPENTELGVFVSGAQLDGAPCDEQLVFEGSGMQIAYIGTGSYEIVPQLPMLMLSDGAVLAASEPITRSYADDALEADGLEIVYAAVDARDMTEEELRDVAGSSFEGEEEAVAAFERALARRGEEAGNAEA